MKQRKHRYEGCYILHFSEPYKHAQHYRGWSTNVPRRIREHKTGTSGIPLINAVIASGIQIEVGRIFWGENRYFEHDLKRTGHNPRFCFCCSGDKALEYPKGKNRVRRVQSESMPF